MKGRFIDPDHDDELSLLDRSERPASLMVALLLKYPEIGSVRVLPRSAALTLSFLLHAEPDRAAYERFQRRLDQSLHILARIEGVGQRREMFVDLRRQGPLTILDIHRDLESLAAEEFPIILGIVKEEFGDLVVAEREEAWETAELDVDFSIVQGVDQARLHRQGEDLIAFRNDGRVLVFRAA